MSKRSDAARELLARRKARTTLEGFFQYLNPTLEIPWFHKYLAERLTAFAKGEIKRLLIEMPPGRAKSDYVSRHLPPFIFGINPDAKILACSHTYDLASKMNRDVQRNMDSDAYKIIFPNTKLGAVNARTLPSVPLKNNDEFDVVKSANGKDSLGGFYKSSGVGAAPTGRRADFILIDDYVKDEADANSPRILDSIWEWFTGDITSRMLPDAGICICSTRRHPKDLTGRLRELAGRDPNAAQYEVITFPEIIEPDYQIPPYDIRKVGELLWPERYDMKAWLEVKATNSPHQVATIYNQRATVRGGNVIKKEWFEPYEHFLDPASIESQCLYWDLGGSDSPDADSTAGTVEIKYRDSDGPAFMYLWQHAGQWNPAQRNKEVLQMSKRWSTIFPGLPVFVEAGIGIGVATVNELKNELIAAGIACNTDPVTQSKWIRASAQKDSFMTAAENRRVKLYAGDLYEKQGFSNGEQEWINAYINEVTKLQLKDGVLVGGKDDRFDSGVGAHNKINAPSSEIEMLW